MRLLAMLSALMFLAAPSFADDEIEIPMQEVPELVLTAALDAMPGIKLSEAEYEMENGQQVYELEGELDGVEYEIEISSAGEVLEIEED
jgi:hypothetical protein